MAEPLRAQNLACQSTGCGTWAIAAYRQEEFDRFLGLDGPASWRCRRAWA